VVQPVAAALAVARPGVVVPVVQQPAGVAAAAAVERAARR
jgi:hypothetical protein